MTPRQIRIKCNFSLGDVVVLTGAIRELHQQYPGAFRTEVKTGFPDLWIGNPYITPVAANVKVVDCSGILIDRTGSSKKHYLNAVTDLFNRVLGTQIVPRDISGDIYLTEQERTWHSDVFNLAGRDIPYWIICPGGKLDIPIKWWSPERYQAVVDHFRNRIQFVQVGTWGNYHPGLKGTIDLRGRTNIRDLIHLIFRAEGVLCGVTSLMHLAAAIPIEKGRHRYAVIVAGAREPERWERYPGQIYLASNGKVSCGCCWLGDHRLSPADDGLKKGSCQNVSNFLPACMDLISADDVISSIEAVLRTGRSRRLKRREVPLARKAISLASKASTFDKHNLSTLNSVERAEAFIRRIPPFPNDRFSGRGIVVCGGGVSYFTNAWVCINMLRQHGCHLPIELWHLGRHEVDSAMEELVTPLGVKCVNARSFFSKYPMRNPLGWELKSYAILHSRFEEVLLLDADNVAARNPEFLFESPEYARTGAIFWPDFGQLGPRRMIWKLAGIRYKREPEFETGQIVVDKRRCWRALNLAFWYNDHSEFFYKYIHGDKETFHLAWRKVNQPYAMPPFLIRRLPGTMCQRDFQGRTLFQHRNGHKWKLLTDNVNVPGFRWEPECLAFLADLRQRWDGKVNGQPELRERNGVFFRAGTWDESIFKSVADRNEYRLPARFEETDIIVDVGAHIGSFSIAAHRRGSRHIYAFEPSDANHKIAKLNISNFPGIVLKRAALLDRRTRARVQLDASYHSNGNTGAVFVGTLDPAPLNAESVQTLALDDVLRKLGTIKLLKLDCEGAEWPLLINSSELWRVEQVCGEYHERASHPLCNAKPLNRARIMAILKTRYRKVNTQAAKDPQLGWFWATEPIILPNGNQQGASVNVG
jgi:FkbM family methyltransferase